ncbi:MAG TPA: 1,4-dihydroxy-2-naphthoate octaprenyltransferase [Candidatus Binataceae bacterium]|nr:1,4-dihydroxy-2-naphthoate octaprenyltransferase [Candidatus Binataceae bacterium]
MTASATPVLLGAAIALRAGFFSPWRLALALFGAVAIQIGTNLINDYYDYMSGIDLAGGMGSSGVLVEGLLTPSEVWWGGVTAFTVGSAAGLVLVHLCGWPILAIGCASVAAGYYYTASPVALGYLALGELTVFVFMGPVIVVGSYYVMAMRVAWSPLIASLPVGLLVAAILHANNIRDIQLDRQHRKLTLANLFSRRAANAEMVALVGGAYVVTVGAAVVGVLPWPVLVTLLTAGRARSELKAIEQIEPAKLHAAVLGAARLHLEFGMLLLVGILSASLLGC